MEEEEKEEEEEFTAKARRSLRDAKENGVL